MSHDLSDSIRAEMTVLPPKVMNSLSIMKQPLESAVLANSVIVAMPHDFFKIHPKAR